MKVCAEFALRTQSLHSVFANDSVLPVLSSDNLFIYKKLELT
jgi:hypothetical protein